MSIQDILRVAGIALVTVSAVLAVAAAYAYRALDIRGVKDDLAGRRRSDAVSVAKTRVKTGVGWRPAPAAPSQPLSDESIEALGQSDERPAQKDRAPAPPMEFRITRKIVFAAGEKAEEE